MRWKNYLVMWAIALATCVIDVAAQPIAVDLNKDTAPLSGRIVITGAGFGSGGVGSSVIIGGLAAWTSSWADTRIVAYIPEEAGTGSSVLTVVAQGLTSNALDLNITERTANERLRWSFEADGSNLWWRPALAPDGTIYLHANTANDGIVYALSPDGALLWLQKVNAYPYVPPTAGPDGAAYVGSIGTIYRLSPDGAIDWEYNPDNGVNIEVAPTAGPDGRVYGAFEQSGAFAVDPAPSDPQVSWSNPGEPTISDKSGEAVETKFGPSGAGGPVDQMYVSVDGGAGFYAFSLDGEQRFTASFGNLKGTAEVAVGSDGTIYGPRALGLSVAAVEPMNGTTLWEYYPGAADWATGTNNVEIGPDDILYFVGSGAKLEAFDPARQTRLWQTFTPGISLDRPTVTPDGSTLIVSGRDTTVSGYPGFVKAFKSGNGRELWTVDLPFQLSPGFRVYGVHHARVTPDGATAYVSTLTLAEWPLNQDPRAFLYAIDIGGASGGKGGGGKGGGGKGDGDGCHPKKGCR